MGTEVSVSSQLTLVEVAKRTGMDGNILVTANNLSKINRMLQDAPWLPCNNLTTHIHNVTLSEPSAEARAYNEGTASGAGTTKNIEEPTEMLEKYSVVDQALIDIYPEAMRAQMRSQEETIFMRGLAKSMATNVVYGNRADDLRNINGLTQRYNALTLPNVQDGGDSGSTSTSVWLIQWGPDKVFFCYPSSSSTLGISANDLGIDTVKDSGGTKEFQAYRTHFKVHYGIVVRDDRAVQRIVSVDPVYGQTNDLDPADIIAALNNLPEPDNFEGIAMYCNRQVKSSLDMMAYNKSNGFYMMPDIFGKPVSTFQGIPIRLMEAILSTEIAI